MKKASISLTKQQIILLKDLIRADISDWQNMASRPVNEVGEKFAHLAKVRIENMQTVLAKLEAIESVEKLNVIYKSGLAPEIYRNIGGDLAVSVTNRYIANFRKAASPPKYRKYSGNIIEAVEERIKANQFTITDIIFCTTNGTEHRFSVSLKVGLCLYLYIHSGRRSDRMNDILFNLKVETDSQKVIEFLAYDSSEWIGDAIERNGKLPKPTY